MLISSFFLVMLGMMIAINKSDRLKYEKLKIIDFRDSLHLQVKSIKVYNGIFEINNTYNLNGPYYKQGDKYTYTTFATSKLDSVLKEKNSNRFIFIFNDGIRDTVFYKPLEKNKNYFIWD